MFGGGSTEIGWLDNKALRDVAAFAQSVEDDEIANEITVGRRFKHPG